MRNNEQQLEEKISNFISGGSQNTFYQTDFINGKKITYTDRIEYYELFSRVLLKNESFIDMIGKNYQERQKSYNCNHDGLITSKDSFSEDLLAIALYNSGLDFSFGRFFDYQVPLKNKRPDKIGNIDLLAISESTVKIVELKVSDNPKDTLLKTIFQVFTYYKCIEKTKSKFLQDYDMPVKSQIKPVIIVGHSNKGDSISYHLSKIKECPNLLKLITLLNSKTERPLDFYTFNYDSDKIKRGSFDSKNGMSKILLDTEISFDKVDY